MASSGRDDDSGVEMPSAPTADSLGATTSASPPSAATKKLLSAIKAVEKGHKFETDTAQALIEKNDFKGLEAYLFETLAFVQGTEQYHHPGIFCNLYHAQISHLMKEDKPRDAEAVLNGKLKPLLSDNEDSFYRPKDLEEQIKKAEKCILGKVEFTGNILTLLSDYFCLYFPSCLTPDTERNGSVFDFVVKRDVNGDLQTHCLACSWVVPQGLSEGELIKHYTGDTHVKRCFAVTEWMIAFIGTIRTDAGAEMVRNPFGKSVAVSVGDPPGRKKRKVSPPVSGCKLIFTEVLMDGINDVHKAIYRVLFYLVKEEEAVKGVVAKMRQLLSNLQKLTCELILLGFQSANVNVPLDPYVDVPLDPYVVYTKVVTLITSAGDLLKLLLKLKHSKRVVHDLYQKITDIMKISLVAEIAGVGNEGSVGKRPEFTKRSLPTALISSAMSSV